MDFDQNIIDLRGQICPLPVINTIKQVDKLIPGQKLEIFVDDPLAIKSIPEELEDLNLDIKVDKITGGWRIVIVKRKEG